MPVPEMQNAISSIKLVLAEAAREEAGLESMRRQFERQLQRATSTPVYGRTSLGASLNVMSEVQERLTKVEMMLHHLRMIKEKAASELEALVLTSKVEEAKEELAALERKLHDGEAEDESACQEIERLKAFITESSIRAGEAITGRLEVERE